MREELLGNTLRTARDFNLKANLPTFVGSDNPLETNNYYEFSLRGRSSFYSLLKEESTINNISTDPNGTLDTATDRGILYISDEGWGSIGYNYYDYIDYNDYYRYDVIGTSRIEINLSGLNDDADLELLDSNGNLIDYSNWGGASSEYISSIVESGTYYVRVYPYNSAQTNYYLNLEASDPDGTLTTASNLGSLSSTQVIQDSISYGNSYGTDWNDYYRFDLSGTNQVYINLNELSADIDIELLDGSGNLIDYSNWGGTNPESISRTLEAGIYYLRVFPYDFSATNYSLRLYARPDYAGDTPDTARSIGSLTHDQTYGYSDDWVDSLDTNDYYRFSLIGQGNFHLDLNGLIADADVELLSSSNQVIARSILGGTSSESIDINDLSAGDYYIRIYQYDGDTNYTLSLWTEYTRIDGMVSNRGPLPWDRVETRPVNIRVPGNALFQNIGDRETWVIVHGHRNSPDTSTISGLEEAIARLGRQVLVLDWSSPADNSEVRPDLSARWIHEVANFAVGALRGIWGISSSNINLIGHSLGSYVSSEIGSIFGEVDRIFALDPAASSSTGGYDINGLQDGFQEISEFDDVSNFALAFWGRGNPVTGGDGLGSQRYAHSADESFRIDFTSSNNAIDNHGYIIELFTYMIEDFTNPISRLFHLDRGRQYYWDFFSDDDEGVIIADEPNRPSRLYFLTPSESWSGTQARAVAAGGNLVTINNAGEQQWLTSTFGGQSYWIGLTDSERYGASEGNFRWVSGQTSTYTNWANGEPNNVLHPPEGEDFVQVIGGFGTDYWNDLPDDPSTIGIGWQRLRGMVEVA